MATCSAARTDDFPDPLAPEIFVICPGSIRISSMPRTFLTSSAVAFMNYLLRLPTTPHPRRSVERFAREPPGLIGRALLGQRLLAAARLLRLSEEGVALGGA